MLNYSGAGGIFTTVGKYVKKTGAYLAIGQTTFPADEDEITAVLEAGNFNQLIGATDAAYTAGTSGIVSLRAALAGLATTRLLDLNTVVLPLGVTNANILSVLFALINQMNTDAQTINANTVTVGAVTPGAENVGNGQILISPILDGASIPGRFQGAFAHPAYNGLGTQLPIAETMTITCNADSYSTPSLGQGNEKFQLAGPLGQTSAWGVGTEGTGLGPTIQNVQAATLIQNGSFSTFANNVPTSWTVPASSGTPGTNILQSTATTYLGGSALQLTGDGATATIAVQQTPNVSQLTPLRRYLLALYYKASATAGAGQSFNVNFTGTGYTAASTEKIAIPGGSWSTSWQLAYFWINLPATLPANFTLSISLTGTVPGGTSVFVDNLGFAPVQYENGVGFASVTGNVPFVMRDTFSVPIGNNYGGLFSTFSRRNWGCQFPASGSPTIPDSLAM
jgi:hypothetical protein